LPQRPWTPLFNVIHLFIILVTQKWIFLPKSFWIIIIQWYFNILQLASLPKLVTILLAFLLREGIHNKYDFSFDPTFEECSKGVIVNCCDFIYWKFMKDFMFNYWWFEPMLGSYHKTTMFLRHLSIEVLNCMIFTLIIS
jgi:hypothetical protein